MGLRLRIGLEVTALVGCGAFMKERLAFAMELDQQFTDRQIVFSVNLSSAEVVGISCKGGGLLLQVEVQPVEGSGQGRRSTSEIRRLPTSWLGKGQHEAGDSKADRHAKLDLTWLEWLVLRFNWRDVALIGLCIQVIGHRLNVHIRRKRLW